MVSFFKIVSNKNKTIIWISIKDRKMNLVCQLDDKKVLGVSVRKKKMLQKVMSWLMRWVEWGKESLCLSFNLFFSPCVRDLDEDLQKAFYKYLEVRGIKSSLTNSLQQYMVGKDNREYLRWLKNMKEFVANWVLWKCFILISREHFVIPS